jgi:hypothetical protein
MSRSTTVRVVNSTKSTLTLEASKAGGRWRGAAPAATVPPGASAVFVTRSNNRFSGTSGTVRYRVNTPRTGNAAPAPAQTIELHWNNPFVGQNSYRMQVDGVTTAAAAVGTVCDGIDDASDAMVTFSVVPARRVAVPGFAPSTTAFRFTNSWSNAPLKRINLKVASIPIGDAANGLCGGMAFAARDFFEARRPVPAAATSPGDKDPLRTFIIDRLIDSYNLPDGVAPYVTFMSARYPDHDGELLATIGKLHSRAAVLARSTFPKVKASVDAGYPCPLGLVMVQSDDLADLKHQHQVLAYAYQVRGTLATMWVYDPNSPLDDSITISYDTARTDRSITVQHNVDSRGPLVCAFPVHYTAKTPPTTG